MSFVTVVANARTSLYDKKCMSFQMQSIHRSPILSLMCPMQLMNHFYDSPCTLVASLIFHWCTHNCYVWSLKWICINIIQGYPMPLTSITLFRQQGVGMGCPNLIYYKSGNINVLFVSLKVCNRNIREYLTLLTQPLNSYVFKSIFGSIKVWPPNQKKM